jgi:hypothetical protein
MHEASQVNVSAVVDDNAKVASMMTGNGSTTGVAQEIIGRQRIASELNFHACEKTNSLEIWTTSSERSARRDE